MITASISDIFRRIMPNTLVNAKRVAIPLVIDCVEDEDGSFHGCEIQNLAQSDIFDEYERLIGSDIYQSLETDAISNGADLKRTMSAKYSADLSLVNLLFMAMSKKRMAGQVFFDPESSENLLIPQCLLTFHPGEASIIAKKIVEELGSHEVFFIKADAACGNATFRVTSDRLEEILDFIYTEPETNQYQRTPNFFMSTEQSSWHQDYKVKYDKLVADGLIEPKAFGGGLSITDNAVLTCQKGISVISITPEQEIQRSSLSSAQKILASNLLSKTIEPDKPRKSATRVIAMAFMRGDKLEEVKAVQSYHTLAYAKENAPNKRSTEVSNAQESGFMCPIAKDRQDKLHAFVEKRVAAAIKRLVSAPSVDAFLYKLLSSEKEEERIIGLDFLECITRQIPKGEAIHHYIKKPKLISILTNLVNDQTTHLGNERTCDKARRVLIGWIGNFQGKNNVASKGVKRAI
jgi:hypothetical protein